MIFHAGKRFESVLVVAESFFLFAKELLCAQPMADVAQVAKSAGKVSFEDIRIELAGMSAANDPHKIGKVIGNAVAVADKPLEDFSARAISHGPLLRRDR